VTTNEVYRNQLMAVLKEALESDDIRVKKLALKLIQRALEAPPAGERSPQARGLRWPLALRVYARLLLRA
jgi:hypothetical protein